MAHVTFCINLLALQFWDSKVQIIILLFMKKKKPILQTEFQFGILKLDLDATINSYEETLIRC